MNTTQMNKPYAWLSDAVKEAGEKFPGLALPTAILHTYLLYEQVKKQSKDDYRKQLALCKMEVLDLCLMKVGQEN